MVGHIVRRNGPTVRPFEYIRIFLVALAHKAAVFPLLFLCLQKNLPGLVQQRKRTVAAGVFGLILFHSLGDLGHRVANGQRVPVKVDAVPLQTQQLTASQSVDGRDFHQRVKRVVPNQFQELLQLLRCVVVRFISLHTGQVNILAGISGQQVRFHGFRQRLIKDVLVQT